MAWKMNTVTLVRFPPELLCHILGFLDGHDLVRMRKTCKALKEIVDNSEMLQYTIDLRYFRAVEVGTYETNVPLAMRRKRLRQHGTAWKRMEYKQKCTLRPSTEDNIYHFAGGIFAGAEDDGPGIHFMRLPSMADPDIVRCWTHPIDPGTLVDFTFCPEQDLLVLLTFTPIDCPVHDIHLRSLKTNETHPDAAQSILKAFYIDHIATQAHQLCPEKLQVIGNYISLLYLDNDPINRTVGDHMQMWDWKSKDGYLFILQVDDGINDYFFLGEDKFLIVTHRGMEIYSIADKSRPPQCTSKLSFPSLMDHWRYNDVPMTKTIDTTPSSVFPRAQKSTDQPSFYPSPDDKIMVIPLHIFCLREKDPHSYFFIARRSAILQLESLYVNTYGQPTSNGPKLLWSTWGPQHTTWFLETSISSIWEKSICGFRTVWCSHPNWLCIRDFNPHIAWNYGAEDTTGCRGRLVRGELASTIRPPFTEPLGSALGYRETISEEFDVTEVVVDESRIVLMTRDNFARLQKVEVLMF
ncbi:hypothetical protein AZE42_05150 [Rhizopogon vesiculosus]|uniref:F-box domain-containing protein n=1 Tax=Rhizopogon vesiculosus TaxID=180088 RepID=A0A1J8QDE1_9AGAM|nr:hypothetical protein AZE42_05150 [Rhizopogon vesiculosus]